MSIKQTHGEITPVFSWQFQWTTLDGSGFSGRLENGKLEADGTIFLWDDPELMAHSAERNLSQLTLVVRIR